MKTKWSVAYWVFGILLTVAVLLVAGYLFLRHDASKPMRNSLIKPLIKDQLKDMIAEASDSLYHVRFNKFDFNLKGGKALITGFELIADKKKLEQLKANNQVPNYLLYYKADSIVLTGFGFKKRDSVMRFDVEKVLVKNPLITIRARHNGQQKEEKGLKEKALTKLAGKLFKRMYVERLVMPGAKIVWVNNNRKQEDRTVIRANIDIKGFSTQPAQNGIVVAIARYKHSIPDSLHSVIFKDIRFVSSTKSATIGHISVMPRLSKANFNKAAKYDKDRYHFELDGIEINGFDVRRFVQRQELHIKNFIVNKVWAEVYKDYHYPKKNITSRRNTYPNDKLRRLAIDVKIDTMRMHNGVFYHRIFPKRTEKVATFVITNIEQTFINVSNIEREVKKNPTATVYSAGKLMAAAPMRSVFVFNLKNSKAPFTLKTTVTSLNGLALNPLLKPLTMMDVKKGTINKMIFKLKADEYRALGNVDLYYSDLKINMLKRDKEKDTLKSMGLVSFFTNAALPNDNPGKDGKLRQGPVNRIRESKETFFGFIWYCMLDGSSSAIMGYDQKKKKPNKNILIKIGEAIAGPKDKDE